MSEQIVKTFFKNRWSWIKETLAWLGIILLIGFIRVNFLGASIAISLPEYHTYSILGSELPKDNSKGK